MPSPDHEAYQTSLKSALISLQTNPDAHAWMLNNADIINIIWETDLGGAMPILQPCYAVHPRGGRPWPPLIMFRAFLLAALSGNLAINAWAKLLRQSSLFQALVGITDEHLIGRSTTSPALGAFYGFLHRLHDGALRHNPEVEALPSEQERDRSTTPRYSQKDEKERKPKSTESASAALLQKLRTVRQARSPNDLLSRLHAILLEVAVKPSAQAGLLGDLSAIITAADGCVLPTNASGRGHRSCDCEERSCDCKRTYGDPDARWGWDSYRDKYFFGHHFYEIIVPAPGHDLPLFVDIHPGNTTDFTAGLSAYERLAKSLRDAGDGWRISVAVLDAGHDALAVHEGLRDWGIRPVIPLSKKAPSSHPDRPDVPLSARGIPLCDGGVELVSRGSAAPQRPLFLCPVKQGKLSVCPLAPADSPDWVCRPDLKFGPGVSVSTSAHPRLFPEIARSSAAYTNLYRRRGGCERSNSVKKQKFKLLSCGHRRQSFWLFRLYTMAILQHARAWISGRDLKAFLAELLSPIPAAA